MGLWVAEPKDAYLVSCDWFALSCVLDAPRGDRSLRVPPSWSVVQMSATAVWADRFFVMDNNGNKVATILCTPRTPKMDERRCIVQVANRWLYHDGFHAIVEQLLCCLPMVPTGLNRVDLCCDFEMTRKLWHTLARLAAGSAYVKALRSGVVWWQDVAGLSDEGGTIRVPHCLSWGGKESILKWKVYYKWLELHQAPPEDKKEYIQDMWRSVGFDEKRVWRCEVSVCGSNSLVGADGKAISPMKWFDDKVSIFSNVYADKFVVRAKQNHKDKRNDDVLQFLDVVGGKMLWQARPQASCDESDPEVRIACKLWKELQSFDVQANDLLLWNVKNSLEQLCERPFVVNMLSKVYRMSVSEIWQALQP